MSSFNVVIIFEVDTPSFTAHKLTPTLKWAGSDQRSMAQKKASLFLKVLLGRGLWTYVASDSMSVFNIHALVGIDIDNEDHTRKSASTLLHRRRFSDVPTEVVAPR